jgi:glycosyltransferase involved in cell wall biosynthesis
MNKIKVLVLPSDRFGVGYFRSLAPHTKLEELFGDKFDVTINYEPTYNIDYYLNYDIIHFHRNIGNDFNKCQELLKELKKHKKITIMDIDDYWNLGQYHPGHLNHERFNIPKLTIENIKLADYITTTTSIFAEEISKINSNVKVLANAIDTNEKQFIPNPTKSNRLRFGVICGSTHEHDIALMNGIATSLPKEIMDKVQFVLCGFDLRGTIRDINLKDNTITERPVRPTETSWFKYERVLTNDYKNVSQSYREFLLRFIPNAVYPNVANEPYKRQWTKDISQYATHYNDIDVLLAPLKETPFNKFKSQLKVIEAGFFKKALIAQDFGPYTLDLVPAIEKGGNINENGNALLVDSSKNHKQWAKYVEKLVKNPELVTKLGNNLYETVKDTYLLDNVTKERADFYELIVNDSIE